jgi:DNA-binding FadR family transcriptional regulator
LDPKAFYEANISFHDAIYVAAHNDYLIQQARALRIRLEPYRRQISFAEGVVQQSLIEHEAITEAIFERNAQLAASAMKAHTAALSNDITSLANLGVSPMELIFR